MLLPSESRRQEGLVVQRDTSGMTAELTCALLGGASGLYQLALWPARQWGLLDGPVILALCAACGVACAALLLHESARGAGV